MFHYMYDMLSLIFVLYVHMCYDYSSALGIGPAGPDRASQIWLGARERAWYRLS